MTAVEWLVDSILTKDEIYDDYGNLIGYKLVNTFTSSVDFLDYVEQAKEMEKEQKIEFACQVAESSAMKYIQGKTTRMIAEELLTLKTK